MWKMRVYRWRKRLLLLMAALPMLQMTGTCDPGQIVGGVVGGVNLAVFNLLVGSARQTLIQDFPSADFLQLLLGNPTSPFFTG